MASTVLITGASGLIGSWLCQHLASEAIAFVPVGRAHTDLLRPGHPTDLLERLRPDLVVHLAWCASGEPGYRHAADNQRWVNATLELHRACARQGVPFWATGTVVDSATGPSDEYTASKVELRHALHDDIESEGIGWLRPYYVFDEVAGRPALVAQALDARARHGSVELRTPDSAHDFVHASDVGRAIVLALLHRKTGELSIGSGCLRSVSDLVTSLGTQWRRGDVPGGGSTVDSGTAADVGWLRQLGWEPVQTDKRFSKPAPIPKPAADT